MEVEEKKGNGYGENWFWWGWDRRQQMAVAQVICYVAYAICVYSVHCDRECSKSVESRKQKGREWEREFRGIREAINDVAEAIRKGNDIIEKTLECVYSEEQVFEEIVRLGVEQPLRFAAYNFLVKDGSGVRAFFVYPADERKEFLLQMIYGPNDP